MSAEKIRVYLGRSGSSPISLRLENGTCFPTISPPKSLPAQSATQNTCLPRKRRITISKPITKHPAHPAPLLEYLTINLHSTAMTTLIFDSVCDRTLWCRHLAIASIIHPVSHELPGRVSLIFPFLSAAIAVCALVFGLALASGASLTIFPFTSSYRFHIKWRAAAFMTAK